jgi:hypothetical protein
MIDIASYPRRSSVARSRAKARSASAGSGGRFCDPRWLAKEMPSRVAQYSVKPRRLPNAQLAAIMLPPAGAMARSASMSRLGRQIS